MTLSGKISGLFLLLLLGKQAAAQTLFTYGNKPVGKEEFLKAYRKNNTETRPTDKYYRDYLELYIRFKLKVQAALDSRIDTLPNQKSELQSFREQVVENFMQDEASIRQLVTEAFSRMQKDIHLAHIYVALPAGGAPEKEKEARERIRKVYDLLKGGESFSKLAMEYSDDPSAKTNGGDIGFVTAFVLPYEMENQAYGISPGKFTAPFQSNIGFHIFSNLGERPAMGKMRAAQILLAFPPDANNQIKEAIRKKADSLYTLLQAGADFKEMAFANSNDNITYQIGGEMPEFGVGRYSPAFENAAFSLSQDGEISRPVETGFGYHIIKRLGRIPVPGDTSKTSDQAYVKQQVTESDRMQVARQAMIKKIMKQTGFRSFPIDSARFISFSDSALHGKPLPVSTGFNLKTALFAIGRQTIRAEDWKNYLESIKNFQNSWLNKPVSQVFRKYQETTAREYYRNHLEDYNKEFAYQLKEFREGNLLFEVMQKKIWDPASLDSIGLRKYYEAHKAKYWWESSADALIITCSNDSIAEKTKNYLKQSISGWRGIADRSSGTVQADTGRFELGQIPVPERTAFSDGLITASVHNETDQSVTFAYIIRMHPNREPRSFNDARGFVINDYQGYLEEKWIAELRKKYPVRVNEAVVKSLPK